eukprot:1136789-Pelagomonas_calceolata.AAC.8
MGGRQGGVGSEAERSGVRSMGREGAKGAAVAMGVGVSVQYLWPATAGCGRPGSGGGGARWGPRAGRVL